MLITDTAPASTVLRTNNEFPSEVANRYGDWVFPPDPSAYERLIVDVSEISANGLGISTFLIRARQYALEFADSIAVSKLSLPTYLVTNGAFNTALAIAVSCYDGYEDFCAVRTKLLNKYQQFLDEDFPRLSEGIIFNTETQARITEARSGLVHSITDLYPEQ